MENVVLIIHLILALGLIAIVLMQRSEGGGLGIGGGGGGAQSGRAPATALGKVTWALATGFIITSISLTIIAAQKSSGASVLDRVGGAAPTTNSTPAALPTDDGSLLPPSAGENAPLVPTAD
jgi:preprotein translocase subunit SecG